MKTWSFSKILGSSGWRNKVEITVDGHNTILSFREGLGTAPKNQNREEVEGWMIPGFVSAHSHAFQYAMSGTAEFIGANQNDDFWSWRESMYTLALDLSPESMQAIATMLYSELLRHGITHVVEFHYLHHDKNGCPYAQKEEMSLRLAAAAEDAGIELTLVPVYYRTGDFLQPAFPRQRRFISKNPEDYLELVASLEKTMAGRAGVTIGRGIHSLRACPPLDLHEILDEVRNDQPFHLHIAEQQQEVQRCKEMFRTTPVRWLLDNVDVRKNFSLVHATHASTEELTAVAKSGATIVICPSTEGNLGDGFFDFSEYLTMGGRWAIGTDSQIGLSPMEDLRWLDYQQRLRCMRRNVLEDPVMKSFADILHFNAFRGGCMSAGKPGVEPFAVGSVLSGVVLNPNHPIFCNKSEQHLLSSLIYSGDPSCFLGVIAQGQWRIKDGKHYKIDEFRKSYKELGG